MKLGCLLNLILYAGLVKGYHFWLSPTVDSPALWIASCVAGLCTLGALGALYNSWTSAKDRKAVEAAQAGLPPRHGYLAAVHGKIIALGEPFTAPFSQTECVICEFEISRDIETSNSSDSTNTTQHHVDFSGIQMVPCAIRTDREQVQLFGFPNLDELPAQTSRTGLSLKRAKEYVQSTEWEDVGGLKAFGGVRGMWNALTEAQPEFRHDWRSIKLEACPWFNSNQTTKVYDTEPESADLDNFDHFDDGAKAFRAKHEDSWADQPADNESTAGESATDADEGSDDFDQTPEQEATAQARWEAMGRQMMDYTPGLQEKRIEVGDEVVALGPYDAMRGALVSAAKKDGQMIRIYRGDLSSVLNRVAGSVRRRFLGGIIALAVINGFLYLGHWIYCHNEVTQKAWRETLHKGAEAGDLAQVDKMLSRGVSIDVPDDEGRTALHMVKEPAVMQHLLDRGANVNAVDLNGTTALMLAVRNKRPDLMEVLIKAGADLNLKNKQYGSTALIEAMHGEREDIIALLRAAGAADDTVTAQNGQPSGAEDAPMVTCRQYLAAIHAHDAEKVRQLSTFSPSFDYATVDWDAWSTSRPARPHLVAGFVRGDDATVTVDGITPGGYHTTWVYQLKQENGQWRVARERWKTQ